MSPVLDAPAIGAQRPRIMCIPETGITSAGQEAIDLARDVGLDLDDWQEFQLGHALAERDDGKWAAREVGEMIPRQNGKGGLLEARELAGLFLVGDYLTIHSAHEFSTSLEAFTRLLRYIEETPWMMSRVRRISKSHGDEGIDLKTGQRIRFRTRTKGGGRGFSADLVVLDEAMILPVEFHGALMPVVSARENPQIWYMGSAVDQTVHEHGIVFARVRERGIAGTDPTLLYAEWSLDRREEGDEEPYTPDRVSVSVMTDTDAWAEANPAYGIRITEEAIASELRSMSPRMFVVERLGVGDWPATTTGATSIIDIEHWRSLADPRSTMRDPVVIAFDTTPNRSSTSICAAGLRPDGQVHGEVIEQRKGTGWVVDRLVELMKRHNPLAIICDKGSPAASLVQVAEDRGVTITVTSAEEYVRACGQFFDMVQEGAFRHLGTPELDTAAKSVATRPLGDAWVWSRRASKVDVSPLVAVTLAAWRAAQPVQESFLY